MTSMTKSAPRLFRGKKPTLHGLLLLRVAHSCFKQRSFRTPRSWKVALTQPLRSLEEEGYIKTTVQGNKVMTAKGFECFQNPNGSFLYEAMMANCRHFSEV